MIVLTSPKRIILSSTIDHYRKLDIQANTGRTHFPSSRHRGLGIGNVIIHASQLEFWHILIGTKIKNPKKQQKLVPNHEPDAQIRNLRHAWKGSNDMMSTSYSKEKVVWIWTIIMMVNMLTSGLSCLFMFDSNPVVRASTAL